MATLTVQELPANGVDLGDITFTAADVVLLSLGARVLDYTRFSSTTAREMQTPISIRFPLGITR